MGSQTTIVDGRYGAFTLDPWQREAVAAVTQGTNVIVAAPTGAGKTLVAEHAVSEALRNGGRVFYTTPIKALSNQKFRDFSAIWGEGQVGLLTGDNSVRPEAPVVVMTTEVLRNMLVAGQAGTLDGLSWVVLDEVHYLSDPYRGGVWEEVLIHSPESVTFVCLSATISNAAQFGQWVRQLRGETKVVTSKVRPVPTEAIHMVYDRFHSQLVVFPPTDKKGKPHPEIRRIENKRYMNTHSYDGFYDGFYVERERRFETPPPGHVVRYLHDARLLPAIYFMFSRDGCDQAAYQMYFTAQQLTDEDERCKIEQIARSHLAALSKRERADINAEQWLARLKSGVGAHHAGLVPVFKEAVEECFAAGLVKVVFATETLALGINMPARTVVIDKLTKWNGTGHAELTPAQFTQLSGRAGRRNIDKIGHVVTLWSPYVHHRSVVGLHASKSFKLGSAFEPNYNMVAYLVNGRTRDEAHAVLNKSFAQFLTNQKTSARQRHVEHLTKRFDQIVEILDGLDYIREWNLTSSGRMLTALHGEQSLLVSEAIRHGVLDGLDTAELAAVASVFIYEQRGRASSSGEPAWPNEQCSAAVERIQSLRKSLRRKERSHRLNLTPDPDNCAGFFKHAYAWAHGASLSQVAGRTMSHGDFIRNIRMLADLLRQIAGAANGTLAFRARESIRTIARGVVVADSMSRAPNSGGVSPSNPSGEPDKPAHLPVVLDAVAGRRSLVEALTRPIPTPPPPAPSKPRTHYSLPARISPCGNSSDEQGSRTWT